MDKAFAALTVMETNAFMRAQKRRQAIFNDEKLAWKTFLTSPGQPIDELLDTNIAAMQKYMDMVAPPRKGSRAVSEASVRG